MIVSIHEIYDGETAIHWFCDADKATPALRTLITKAVAHPDSEAVVSSLNSGFQDQNNHQAQVNPPCQIDAAITLWES